MPAEPSGPGRAVGPGEAPGPPDPDRPPGTADAAAARDADDIAQAILTGATYGVLFVLGAFLGLVGALEHSWYLDPVGEFPVVAIAWLVVLFAVPYGMGRLMGSRLAALMTAIGWGVVSAALSVHRAEGDLLIAATGAGYTYLYGGMLAVGIAVLAVPSNTSWLLTPRFGAPRPPDGTAGPRS